MNHCLETISATTFCKYISLNAYIPFTDDRYVFTREWKAMMRKNYLVIVINQLFQIGSFIDLLNRMRLSTGLG